MVVIVVRLVSHSSIPYKAKVSGSGVVERWPGGIYFVILLSTDRPGLVPVIRSPVPAQTRSCLNSCLGEG